MLVWPTGVEGGGAAADMMLYPNPAVEQCRVRFSGMIEQGGLELYSMLGVRVFSMAIDHAAEVGLQLGGLVRGMYVVRVVDGERVSHARLVVE